MTAPQRRLVGVLGGMGPAATVDFLQRLLDAHPVSRDQDHVPTVVWNVPQIPDRQLALAGQGADPLPAMAEGMARLNAAGATCIAIPCNTAHAWWGPLSAHSAAPVLHIVDVTVQALRRSWVAGDRVGVLATQGALRQGLYQSRLEALCLDFLVPDQEELDTWFTPGCYAIKANDIAGGGRLLAQSAQALLDRGATRLVLGCTEIPIGLKHAAPALLARSLDPATALAHACIDHWLGEQGPSKSS
ncbi:MAG: aspartate/glutamate racemase family protein [Ottowia sp.]|nr:aspartate/glutamate racemase family protein [Ottowia sp.]